MSNEHFNWIAGIYDKVAQFRVDDRFMQEMELPAKGVLLDIGGGTGRAADLIRGFCDHVIVVDVSMGMMGYAALKGLVCIYAPAESLPFASNSVDRILMLDTFHHVKDQIRTVNELVRVLKPGGCLLVIEPDIDQFPVKLISMTERILLMRSNFLIGEKIRKLFIDQGEEVLLSHIDRQVWIKVKKNESKM